LVAGDNTNNWKQEYDQLTMQAGTYNMDIKKPGKKQNLFNYFRIKSKVVKRFLPGFEWDLLRD
jgi:hypothetical protein